MLGVAVIAAVLLYAAVAFGYAHSWSCSRTSASTCYDTTGQTFNAWENVSGAIEYPLNSICAKANTSAGNTRTGSGCDYGVRTRYSNIAGGTPTSHAYVYWTGTSPAIRIDGHADTSD